MSKGAYLATEKQIERNILSYLALKKITAWKQNNGCLKVGDRFVRFFIDHNGKSIKGIPDIAGYLPDGRALFIEVKKPGKYPSKDQKAFLENAKKSGCVAFVARDISDVDKEIGAAIKPGGDQKTAPNTCQGHPTPSSLL